MIQFIIEGGKPLKGTVRIGGAKNSSFKLMIASLLTEEETRILNIPEIDEISITENIIKSLGGKVERPGEKTVFINSKSLSHYAITGENTVRSRASIIFAGPLLKRFGKAILPFPGGDKIGKRPIDRHLDGLRAMGVKIGISDEVINLDCPQLHGANYCFNKSSHTGTETLIMAAVCATGQTTLDNAAQEPEIDDLINFLNKMGGQIKRLPNKRIQIDGVKSLHGAIHKIMPDRNEAVSYACAALGTKGDIIIENIGKDHIQAFLAKVDETGGRYEASSYGVRFWYEKPLSATHVTTAPHPGFMSDWQPLWTTLMTQATGTSEIVEAIYEYRLEFVKDLNKMGAHIQLFNPDVGNPEQFYAFNWSDNKSEYYHGARVVGATTLQGGELDVPDIRAGATMVLAALIAQGTSTINGIEHIDRGYEKLDSRLQEFGAQIRRNTL